MFKNQKVFSNWFEFFLVKSIPDPLLNNRSLLTVVDILLGPWVLVKKLELVLLINKFSGNPEDLYKLVLLLSLEELSLNPFLDFVELSFPFKSLSVFQRCK